jgi:Domain of unknown function (DUF4411)
MPRLLDANVLITANNLYYPIDMVPEFWEWLAHMGHAGEIKLPIEIFEEITDGGPDEDPLKEWLRDEANKLVILLDDEVDQLLVQRVLAIGYATDLADFEIEQIGRDPFLIAYALADPAERSVVTTEVSSPRKTRQNRKIPDVCDALGISWSNTFTMLRELRFSTAWRQG